MKEELMKHLKENGIESAVRQLSDYDYKNYCLFNADVAESVLHIFEEHSTDQAPRNAIKAVRDWHAGEITDGQLNLAASPAAAAYAAAAAASPAAAAYAAAAAAAYAVAAYAAAAAAAYAVAAYAYAYAVASASNAVYTATAAAGDAAAAAAAAAAGDAAAAAAGDADAARDKKWQEIEELFIKHFGE